jgi:hypothetical protein
MFLNISLVVLSKDFVMFWISSANLVLRSKSRKVAERNHTAIEVEVITIHKCSGSLGHKHRTLEVTCNLTWEQIQRRPQEQVLHCGVAISAKE